MYLHLGQSVVVPQGDVVGIFDLEITSQSRITRDFLNRAQKEGLVESVSQDLPKAFLVRAPRRSRIGTPRERRRQDRVYLSQLASATLKGRAESGVFVDG